MKAMNPEKVNLTVKELELETLPEAPAHSTTTTDQPVRKDTRETIAAVLANALRARKSDLANRRGEDRE